MAQPNRRVVSIRTVAWEKAAVLRDELAEKSGRRVTLSDTVERAFECLEDAHSRGAWLSPREAEPVLATRLRKEIVSVLKQLIAWMPDVILEGVTFRPSPIPRGGEILTLHLNEGKVTLLVGGAETIASPEPGEGHHA